MWIMDDLRRELDAVLARVAVWEAAVAERDSVIARQAEEMARRDARVAELEAQVAELTVELQRRKKGFRPKANAIRRPKKDKDGRKAGERKHPGVQREDVPTGPDDIIHDLRDELCPHCGGSLDDTGEFDEHVVEEIPQPQVEVHRYRRHKRRCACCRRVSQPAAPPEVADAYIGPRAKLLAAYCRGHLGISLGKTADLMHELFGLKVSRAGTLGHVLWAGRLFDPIVKRLFDLLKSEPVIHADETGWRINGKNVWVWCFCNPRLALFLVDKHRSAAVVKEALGDSLEGVLVTDFYAAYHAIDCHKQKCLVHLLRELHTLRDDASNTSRAEYLQPLMTLLQDAIAPGKSRSTLATAEYESARQSLERRLDTLIDTRPADKDCHRINNRLVKHRFDLFRFLTVEGVPADNNPGERDIRSVAAARSDGGVNRSEAGASAFASIKSIVRTCQKQGLSLLNYGLSLLGLTDQSKPLPLAPLNTS